MGKVIIEQNDFDLSLGGSGSGSSAVLEPLTIKKNGVYVPPEGTDGFNTVTANVQPNLEYRVYPMITENGKYAIRTSNSNKYDGMRVAAMEVNVRTPAEEQSVKYTENGKYVVEPSGNNQLSKVNVTVDVPSPIIQADGKTVYITENGIQLISPDAPNNYLTLVEIHTDVDTTKASVVKGLNAYLQAGGKFGNSTFDKWPYSTVSGIFDGVTDLQSLFANCSNMSNTELMDWWYLSANTTSMVYMFDGCKNLEKIQLPHGVCPTTVRWMFNNCSSLAQIIVPDYFTSKLTTASYWFNNCTNLESIDLTSDSDNDTLSFATVNHHEGMFSGCTKLKSVIGTHKYDDIETNALSHGTWTLRSTGLVALQDLGLNKFQADIDASKIDDSYTFNIDWTSFTKYLRYSSILALLYGLPDLSEAVLITEKACGKIKYSGEFLSELYDDNDEQITDTEEYTEKLTHIGSIAEGKGYEFVKIDK